MKSEKPNASPPMNAANREILSARRRHPYADTAVSTGAAVSATFSDAIGPNSHVTGASTTPSASTLVLASRFIPLGTCTRVVRNRLWPWVIAYAGQVRNHTNDGGSPQPQVIADAGCPLHT